MPRYTKGVDYAVTQAKQHEARLLKMYGCDIEAFLASCRESATMASSGPGMIAASILSDAQELIAAGCPEEARQMINRAKRWISDSITQPFIAAQRATALDSANHDGATPGASSVLAEEG
jgi:hypothetical protein